MHQLLFGTFPAASISVTVTKHPPEKYTFPNSFLKAKTRNFSEKKSVFFFIFPSFEKVYFSKPNLL